MYLTTKWTESEGIKKAAGAYLTSVGDPFTRPRLGALIEEDNLGTVDDVGLNTWYVYVLLYLIYPYYVVVRRSPYLYTPHIQLQTHTLISFSIHGTYSYLAKQQCTYIRMYKIKSNQNINAQNELKKSKQSRINDLNNAMVFMMNQTVRAKSIGRAVQAIHIALTFIGIPMNWAGYEVICSQHGLQPWWTLFIITIIIISYSYSHSHSNYNWTHLLFKSNQTPTHPSKQN